MSFLHRPFLHRRAAIVAGIALVALAVGLAIWLAPSAAPATRPAGAVDEAAVPAPAAGPLVDLYFPDDGNRLHAERRRIAAADRPEGRVAAVVAALLAGPQGGSLRPPLPDGVKLEAVFLWPDGTAVVDLGTADGGAPQGWGSQRELLAVYSLVDSITTAVPEAKRVTFLWNGHQRATFAGHVDTTRPVVPAPDLVAGGR